MTTILHVWDDPEIGAIEIRDRHDHTLATIKLASFAGVADALAFAHRLARRPDTDRDIEDDRERYFDAGTPAGRERS